MKKGICCHSFILSLMDGIVPLFIKGEIKIKDKTTKVKYSNSIFFVIVLARNLATFLLRFINSKQTPVHLNRLQKKIIKQTDKNLQREVPLFAFAEMPSQFV